MKKILTLLLVMAAIIAVSTPSNALMLTITSGSDTVSFDDTDGDGFISYTGNAFGSWTKMSATGFSYPIYGNEGIPVLHLDSFELNGAAANVTVTLSDTFNSLNSAITGFNTSVGGLAGGTMSLISMLDSTTMSSLGTFGPGGFNAIASSLTLPTDSSDYMLTLVATVNHSETGQLTSFNAEIAPVPEPGTILLLGAGLAGVGFYTRRKKI